MIAMATILRPALLIADEPTTALDVTTQAEVLRLIAELQREHNTAVLFITHDFGVVAEIADTVAVLQAGEVVEAGPCREVLVQPQHPYTRMLLQAVPDLRPRKTAPNTGAVRLTMSNVSKVFHTGGWLRSGRWVRAADSIDLEIRAGETLGIVGESGSGKSTVARLAACLLEPTGGHIDLDGTRIHRPGRHVERTFRRRVQIVFQDPYRSLNPRRTVGAAIMEGPINFGATRADARRRAAALMEMVKLSPASLDRYPHEFSGGQRQRICIARAIAVEPEVLIADEAVSALDVSVQAQILMLLDDLQQRLNLALVFITHDIRVAAQICHSLLVMHEGRVLERGPISTVFSQPSHEYTRRLFDAVPGRQYAFGSAT
jgi:peptide/nickel transport system ATP-binding protein